MNARRPRTVTLLSVGVLTIAILFLTRLVQAVNRWGFFVDLSVSPLYLAATGAAFGAAGILVAWGLWQGKPWGGRLARCFSLAIALYYWIDRLLIAKSDIRQANTPFVIAITILSLIFVFWTLARSDSERRNP